MSVRELLTTSWRDHRGLGVVCALLTLGVGLAARWAVPPRWVSTAEVFLSEPVVTHRLANPFTAIPSQREGLQALPERLKSKAQLEALIARTQLVERWEAMRPPALRLKDAAMRLLRGPADEAVKREALVAMVDSRLHLTVLGSHVQVYAEWSDPDTAFALVEGTIEALKQQGLHRAANRAGAAALDAQLAAVKSEVEARIRRIEEEHARAARERRLPVVEGEWEQLRREQSRAEDLLVRAEEKHIALDVMERSQGRSFLTLKPPARAQRPHGPGAVASLALVLMLSVVCGVVASLAGSVLGGPIASAAQVEQVLHLPVITALRAPGSRRPKLRRHAVAGLMAVGALTGVAFGASRGNPLVAAAPLVAAVVAWAVWTQPLKWPLLALMLAAVTVDDPSDRPYFGLWSSPLSAAGKALYGNVAWFTGFELAVMALTAVLLVRQVGGPRWHRSLDPEGGGPPRALRLALFISGLTVVWLIALGLARGGVFREALWQFRTLAMMPLVCTLALYAFEFPKDLKYLLGILMVGSVVKALLGAYFIYRIAYPSGQYPPHTTGHNDSMIFVVAAVVAVLILWERPTKKHLFLAAAWLPFVAIAVRLNDRRIAWIDLAVSLGFIYLVSPMHRTKRFATRAALVLLPVFAVYVAAGWSARSPVFLPVQKLRSIVDPVAERDESSNLERDIENYNIVMTWKQNPMLGEGFGHAFREHLPSYDFGQSAFGHIGHNSLLWLMWIGGVVGFTGVLSYLTVAAYCLGRALRHTHGFQERVALQAALTILVTYLLQSFGDMGTQAMQYAFFVGVAVAIAGRLVTSSGAWRRSPTAIRPAAVQLVPSGSGLALPLSRE